MNRMIFSGLATAALLALSWPAWSQQEPLRVGAILALSGPASVYGGPAEKGLKVMLDQLPGKTLAGHPVELTIFDTEGNSTKAVQLFRRLVDNNEVHVIVGPSTSGESLAIVPVANQLQVSVISNGGAEQITQPVTPYVFGMAPTDRLMVELTLDTLVKRNQKKVALIHSQDGFGQSGGGIVQAQAPKFGIDLVAVETFSPQDTNMTPQLLRVRDNNPDAIVIWASNPGPTIVLKNAAEMNLRKPTYVSYGNATMSFISQTGAAAEGVYCGALPIVGPESLPANDPRRAPMLAFDQAYRKQFNQAPDMTSGHGLDDFIILEAALKAIKGPLTRDNLRSALETVQMCGANGCRQVTPSDHRGLTKDAAVLMQVRNGKWEAVQP